MTQFPEQPEETVPSFLTLGEGGGDYHLDDGDDTAVDRVIRMLKSQTPPLVRKTTLPHKQESEFTGRPGYETVVRDNSVRFERGQMLAVYRFLRRQRDQAKAQGGKPDVWKDLLKEFRQEASPLARQIDELNRQIYMPATEVTLESEALGQHTVPVSIVDLTPHLSNDLRIPYVLMGTATSDTQHMTEFGKDLALAGEKVYMFPWPEMPNVKQPKDWEERLKKAKGLELHAEYTRKIIEKLGLPTVNILGYSMGGGAALALAAQKDFDRIQDLRVLEPVGLRNMGTFHLLGRFISHGIFISGPDSETEAKTMIAPRKARFNMDIIRFGLPLNRILARQSVTTDDLANVHPKGRYQVWIGSDSLLTDEKQLTRELLEADRARVADGEQPVEVYQMEGGHHGSPGIQTLGMIERWNETPEDQVTHVLTHELENSAALLLLKKLQLG